MTKQEIIEKTNAFFIHTLDFDPAMITPDTELRRDLGITSVDAVAIASFVQKTFGCTIDMREMKAIITVDDLYDYIDSKTKNI
ncbi:MAG: acyl carrier protein [Paludibacteraceae bacterium]|nr:acyl carrier protein [Paludibacteraceae bacterium]